MKIHMPSFEKTHVVVVGDVILDRYWHGNTHRISPEAPVPVVNVQSLREQPGGAGNVAANLRSLGCEVTLLSLVGEDSMADVLEEKLQSLGIHCCLERVPQLPTITKLRVIDKNQQLIRLDFEENFSHFKPHRLLQEFEIALESADVVILSDYAKGTLAAISELIHLARKKEVPIFIDPKSTNFDIYRHATIITPNLKEFEAVVGKCKKEEDIVNKGMELIDDYDLEALLITRSEQGMTLLRKGKPSLHLPTRAREVYDVTGAGDTVIAVLSAAVAAGEEMDVAAYLANIAAGIVVRKMGAASVSVPELRRAVQKQSGSEFGILSQEELLIAVADARAHGEKIVMTNGCFDLLHPGHIAYLEDARNLGSRLVVAVNDDASITRLKGPARPINALHDRMAMVAALRPVDWVVSFTEDTPARLIQEISPDILVKGEDYQIHEIAGADHVLSYGGEVKVLPFVQGYSSSNLIHKILKNNNIEEEKV